MKKTEDYLAESEKLRAMAPSRQEYNQNISDIDVDVEYVQPNQVTTTDPVVLAVIRQLDERSKVGLKKYKKPLSEDERSLSEWCQMALEEALDFSNYMQKTINELKKKGL